MLEIKDDKVVIYYKFEGELYDYEMDLYDVKFGIVYDYLKETKNLESCKIRAIVDVLDKMEYYDEIDWKTIIENNEESIMEENREEAKECFKENQYSSEEDYESNLADAYNDEKWMERE